MNRRIRSRQTPYPHVSSWSRALPHGLSAVTLSVALALTLPSAPAHAQQTAQSLHLNEQPLASALVALANRYGLQLAYSPELVQGINAPALSGTLTVDQALTRLLMSSGITFIRHGVNVALSRTGDDASAGAGSVTQLQTISVTGNAPDSIAQTYNPPTMVGSKTPLTQREIPQTVYVLSSAQIQQQHLINLNDAVTQIPGVTAAPYNAGQVDFYSRGFPVDVIQLDGIPFNVNLSANGMTNLSLAMYDHVEALDGPAGLLNGFGGAGGSLNLVRKRPQQDFALDGDFTVGNYANRSETLDVTGPLNESGTVRGRLVESAQDTHLQAEGSYKKQALVYGIVEANITPDTLVSLGGSYQYIDQKTMENGYPAWSDGQLLKDPTRYIGSPDDDEKFTTTTLFGSLEQQLAAGWKAKFTAQAWNTSSRLNSAFPYGTGINVDTGNTNVSTFANRESNVQRTLDLFASGPVSLFGQTHQLTVGMDYQTYHFGLHDIYNFSDIQTYNYFDPVSPVFFKGDSHQTSFVDLSQFNLYANARIHIFDPLTLVVGGAVSWWKIHNTYGSDANNTFGYSPTSYSLSGKVTPFVGLIYDINKNLSVYTSYTSIFEPQTAVDESGNLIAPLKGKQVEAGIKGSYLGGKLTTSASVFQIQQENRAIADPDNPDAGYDIASGKARSRGVQLSASGELSPGWTVSGGYTYTNAMSFDSSDSATGTSAQSFSLVAPKHLLRLWTNYQLHGVLNKLSVGGGINMSSRYWTEDGNYSVTQGGYTTVGLQAGYAISKNVSMQLNVNNLFNRHYYQSIGGIGNGNFLGDPRTVMLSLHLKM